MANVTRTYTFVNGQPADATQVNKNFDDLLAGINADVSATDKVLGRATAGAGPVEEIACTAAGRALLDDASATVQIATLGLDADIATLALPANTTISAAGAELINDADAAAQRTTLGAVATGDARLSDARVASDVYVWAKAASAQAMWPVGSVFTSVVATNPNTLLGFGTWGAIAAGRVLLGLDSGDANFDAVRETGGAKTVQASAQSFTGSSATTSQALGGGASVTGGVVGGALVAGDLHTHTVTAAGSNAPGAATSVVQPYFVVYFWERTA